MYRELDVAEKGCKVVGWTVVGSRTSVASREEARRANCGAAAAEGGGEDNTEEDAERVAESMHGTRSPVRNCQR